MKDYKKMADLVIEILDKKECPPITIAMAGTKENLEKSYKILTEDPQITLKQFLDEMNLDYE